MTCAKTRRLLQLVAAAAFAIAAGACRTPAPVGARAVVPASCPPVVLARLGDSTWSVRESPEHLRAVIPAAIAASFGKLLYADTVDLDCDGAADLVVQAVTLDSAARLVDVVYVNLASGPREVLRTPSSVEGFEALAIAADLSGTGKRDVILLGGDEGGYVPRVFRWRADRLREVVVPARYTLRLEADWSVECQRRANPGLAKRGITLMRETISPTSLRGHGTDCALPVDTLVVRGDSLVAE